MHLGILNEWGSSQKSTLKYINIFKGISNQLHWHETSGIKRVFDTLEYKRDTLECSLFEGANLAKYDKDELLNPLKKLLDTSDYQFDKTEVTG